MKYFNFFSRQQLLNLTAMRKFETKIGEVVEAPGDEEGFKTLLANENIKYVLFGIPEDIGVKANFGKGGADSAWRPFLPRSPCRFRWPYGARPFQAGRPGGRRSPSGRRSA